MTPNPDPSADRVRPLRDEDPEQIGPYRILGVLGEGGMGVVYLAEQLQPVRRRVAVKLIKLGLGSREVLARFEAEWQALARMTHEGIAKIYDAGSSEDGQPYFAMEYVDGLPITSFCEQHGLGLRQRVQLFVQVCEAMHHAHLNAIIHRDLSPQNILVRLQDGAPVPKIIDFGVAKSLDEPLTDRTYYTRQHVLLGKPAYLPPEQAGLSAAQVNATADIYSLGVVLYELVAGVLPFDDATYHAAANTGYEALLKLIRDSEPPRPSDRVARLGARAVQAAAGQHTSVPALIKSLRDELDWICMRAIDKDSSRRYASASELAGELRRYLNGEAVLAGPPTTWYRLRKSVRRHRVAVAAGAAVVLSLTIGLSVATAMYVRAEHQRKAAVWRGYLANIRAASASLRDGEVRDAKQWLEACDPSLRGWEWDHLLHRTDASRYSIRVSRNRILWCGFSPDGHRMAATAGDGTLRMWTWGQGAPRPVFASRLPRRGYFMARFSPDGARLAIGSADSTVVVLDVATGLASPPHRGAYVNVLGLAWSPDGTRLAVTSDSPRVPVLDARTGRELLRIALPATGSSAVLYSTDGRRLIVGLQSGRIREFDSSTGRPLGTYPGHEASVTWLALSPDGRRLVSTSEDQTVRVWDTHSRELLGALRDHKGNVNGVTFRRDGRLFATCSYDKTVRVWDAASLRCVRVLYGHEGYVYPVEFSPDGRYLVSGGDDERVRVWDLDVPENPTPVACDTAVTALVALPAGGFVAGDARGRLLLWRRGSQRPDRVIVAHHASITALSVSRDGSVLASAGADGLVRTWDSVLDPLAQAHPDSLDVNAVAVSPDGRMIALGSGSGVVRIWDWPSGSPREVLRHADRIQGLAFSPDGALLASVSWKGGLVLRNTTTHDTVGAHPQGEAFMRVAFTSDSRRVVTGSWFGKLRIWDARTCQPLAVLNGHNSVVLGIAVSPDGQRIATVSQDRTLRLWDAESGEPLLSLEGHSAGLNAVSYSAGGDSILTGSDDRTIRVWRR